MTCAWPWCVVGGRWQKARMRRASQRDGNPPWPPLTKGGRTGTAEPGGAYRISCPEAASANAGRGWRADEGGAFLLAGARYRYTKALWITGLADRLPMYDTVDEALAALAGTGSGAASSPGASEPEATAE